jgi:hypothetical protein
VSGVQAAVGTSESFRCDKHRRWRHGGITPFLKASLLKFVSATTLSLAVASLLDAWYAGGGGVLQREVGAAMSGDVARQR